MFLKIFFTVVPLLKFDIHTGPFGSAMTCFRLSGENWLSGDVFGSAMTCFRLSGSVLIVPWFWLSDDNMFGSVMTTYFGSVMTICLAQ